MMTCLHQFHGAYPVDSRSEVNVRNSIKFFMGDRKIKLLRGDSAEEFEKAANTVEIPFDNSVPNLKVLDRILWPNPTTLITTQPNHSGHAFSTCWATVCSRA